MGCDIHLFVERCIDGVWTTADKWVKDEYEPDRMRVDYKSRFYNGRNYNLFAILANVRNGHGFAGIKTGEGFIPLTDPRGIPDDACPEYRTEAQSWGEDGHSHSHITLAELLAYDWTQTTQLQGYVTPAEWAKWRDDGAPRSYSGEVGGRDVTKFNNSEFERAWQTLRKKHDFPEVRRTSSHFTVDQYSRHNTPESLEFLEEFKRVIGSAAPHTLVHWTKPYYACAGEFWSETIPRLLALAQGNHDDVRIVFFFDN